MIIDFRLRPATRGFLNMHIFRNQERIASWSGKLGMVPPPSAKQGDMELMLKEMEEGGVTGGVDSVLRIFLVNVGLEHRFRVLFPIIRFQRITVFR